MSLTAFRLREAEEKMREAASVENYEEAIGIRENVRKMRDELKNPEEKDRRVIDLFSKEPFEEEPEDSDGDEEDSKEKVPIDKSLIEWLEELTEQAKKGQLNSMVILTPHLNNGVMVDINFGYTMNVLDNAKLFAGGAQAFSKTILELEDDLYLED